MKNKIHINLPNYVETVLNILQNNKYEAYVVGGAIRNSLLHQSPKDYDLTTNALPNEVIRIFIDNGYKVIETGIKHGTVTVLIESNSIEITTYRIEGEYKDNRHPENVTFTNSLKEDLSRRDFTINAMAYNHKDGLVDYFNGLEDLKNKIIKTVGNPNDRFTEDALRMMRCIRFASQLDFNIEEDVCKNIIKNKHLIQNISKERIREELCKILISDKASYGIRNLCNLGLMNYIIPELNECIGFNQHNKNHDKDVFEHIMGVIDNSPNNLIIRLSALLHDIAKPKCFTMDENGEGHFYKHHIESAIMAEEILKRLKFDNKTIKTVSILVREHMSRYDFLRTPNIKKFINRVGIENLDLLFELQIADIKSSAKRSNDFSGVLNLKSKCEKILQEKQPLTTKDLKINGNDLKELGFNEGKIIGQILKYLSELVLENDKLNDKNKLIDIVKQKYK